MLIVISVLAMQVPALADCPFGWSPEREVPGIGSNARAIVTWNSDGAGPQPPLLVVGGWTTEVEDVFTGSVATSNGTAWTALGSGMNERVEALTVYNGDLYAGGYFTFADGAAVNCIARWDGTTWQDVGNGVRDADPNPNNPPRVLALEVYDGKLVVGGRFDTAGGAVGFNNIAMWDGQSWHTMGTGTVGRVHALAAYGSSLYAGGLISNAGGTPVNRIARWSGFVWEPVPNQQQNGTDNQVHSLAVCQDKLFAGGWFTIAAGLPANSIAAWDGNTWNALGDGITGSNTPTVNAMTEWNGLLIAGGRFTTAGTQSVSNIAAWDGVDWQAFGSFDQRVSGLAVSGVDLVAGGFFSVGNEGSHLARWRPNCLPGDMNCDQEIDEADVPLFIDALLNAPTISSCESHIANMNGDLATDGQPKVDGLDIAQFVQAMLIP